MCDLPPRYQLIDAETYEPEYPDSLQERDALNALFGPADDDEDNGNGELEDFSSSATSSDFLPEGGVDLKQHLADIEVLLEQALERSEWVVAHAAELLTMRRTTLVEKMKKYQLNR